MIPTYVKVILVTLLEYVLTRKCYELLFYHSCDSILEPILSLFRAHSHDLHLFVF